MLFFIDGNFIEVLRETCYKGILTFCGPSRKALLALKASTLGEPIRLNGQAHKWALHIPEDQAPEFVSPYKYNGVEKVDRITGPALAYAYDYILESSLESEGSAFGDYGYCWPEEVEETERSLFEGENLAVGEVFFVPIWTLPDELTGAPRENLEVDDEKSQD